METGHHVVTVPNGRDVRKPVTSIPRTEWLGDNVLRIHLDKSREDLGNRTKPGTLFRARHYTYDNHGFMFKRMNSHLTIADVTLFSCPGFGFQFSGEQHHVQFLRTNVIPPSGSRRPISCTADGIHITNSQGFFRMEDCEFGYGGDDCLNAHDNSDFAQKIDANTVRIRNNLTGYRPGDPVEICREDMSPYEVTLQVESIKALGDPGGERDVSFTSPIPVSSEFGVLLFNRRFSTGNIIIRNCKFHNNRARGMLLQGYNITVEGNFFIHNETAAIKIDSGYTLNSWCEGYGARNIVIRNNFFQAINMGGGFEMGPVIRLSAYMRGDPGSTRVAHPIVRDVLIEGNTFENCPGAIATIRSSANVIVRGNVTRNQDNISAGKPIQGWIGIDTSSGVYVYDNAWESMRNGQNPSVRQETDTCKDIYVWGNMIR